MTSISEGRRPGLVARIVALLLHPQREWRTIAAEPTSIGALYIGYILPLAALAPLAHIAGGLIFGMKLGGTTFSPVSANLIIGAIVALALNLIAVYVLALAIDAAAPSFKAEKSRVQALKVAAYSATPVWLSQVFGAVPFLTILELAGLYSLVLAYFGLREAMKTPAKRGLLYTAVVFAGGALVVFIVGAVTTPISRAGLAPALGSAPTRTIVRPVAASDPPTSAVRVVPAAPVPAAPVASAPTGGRPTPGPPSMGDQLQTLLPGDLAGGYNRVDKDTATAGVGAATTALAQRRYAKGDGKVTLKITDFGAKPVNPFRLQTSQETATGYVKSATVNGRLTTEEYDRQSHRGRYAVVVAGRYVVEASGEGVSVDVLKAAVETVDAVRLEAIAKG